jgi:HPt (histidine-containing phosphotransfer) domain-containing protein
MEVSGMEPESTLEQEPKQDQRSAPAIDDVFLKRLRIIEGRVGFDLVLQLIDLLISDTPKRLRVLEAAVASAQADEVCSTAHAIKGSASALGADTLAEKCYALEKLGRSGSVEGGEELLSLISIEYDRVVQQCELIRKRKSLG